MSDDQPEQSDTTQPVLRNVISWAARQDEDGTGEIVIRLSDGGAVRQWADFLAELWACGAENKNHD